MTHTVTNGQDIFDVVLQRYGDMENAFDMLALNPGLNIDGFIQSGDEIEFNNDELGIINIKERFTLTNFVVMNADEELLSETVGDFNNDFNNDYF